MVIIVAAHVEQEILPLHETGQVAGTRSDTDIRMDNGAEMVRQERVFVEAVALEKETRAWRSLSRIAGFHRSWASTITYKFVKTRQTTESSIRSKMKVKEWEDA